MSRGGGYDASNAPAGGTVEVIFFVIGYVVTWFLAGVAIQAAVMLS